MNLDSIYSVMRLGDADEVVGLMFSKKKKKLVIEMNLHQKQEIKKIEGKKKNFFRILSFLSIFLSLLNS